MKMMLWPEVAGSEWIAYGHRVKVDEDGRVEAHPDVLELYAEKLGHYVTIVEVDEDGREVTEDEPEAEATTSEPEPEAKAISDEAVPSVDPRPLEERTDEELRALAKKHDVKLGRTKSLAKIAAKLIKAGVTGQEE